MKFGVFMFNEGPELANMCLETIRHHHPYDTIVHLTDMETPMLELADEVVRLPFKDWPIRLRMDHLCQIEEEPFVSIDTDMLVCENLKDIFDEDFDVAITERPLNPGQFNCGIMFYQKGDFFRELYKFMEQQSLMDNFMGIERAMPLFLDPRKWNVKKVPAAEWNCWKMEQYPTAKVMHYKGTRKNYMREHFQQRIWE